MSDTFLSYMRPILLKEGGNRYTNDPVDSGGETRWGMTAGRARAAGYTGSMRTITLEQVLPIYELFFWKQPMFDQINRIFPELAVLMLDFGINMGPTWPGRFLQRALNVLNAEGVQYPDVNVDGVCGAMTRAALFEFMRRRGKAGETTLLAMIRAQASMRYMEIAENKPSQERFAFGWQSQRAFGVMHA